MNPNANRTPIKLGIPKGRMEKAILQLLAEAGLPVSCGTRTYRPQVASSDFEAKLLKPQNIVEMVALGSRDIGFCGADWVAELDANVVELLDTGLNPVRIVAAAPGELLLGGKLPQRSLLVASEYERLTAKWIEERGLDARFVHSHGATEVFPPEDADCIVDNTATGSTLKANGLTIFDELLRSSTRLYVNPQSLEDTNKRRVIEDLVLVLRSVLDARRRVMLEVNVSADNLESVIAVLPCMREPTIAQLHGGAGYAVKAAVPREDLAALIPLIKNRGGSDIIVIAPSQIVP